MSDTKNNVSIYNEYLKSINDVKRKVRNAQNIKRKALKKDINASEEDIKLIENKALTNEKIDFNCNDIKIYCFSNGDKYIGKIKDAKMDGIGIYSFFTEDERELEYAGEFKANLKEGYGQYIFPNGNTYIGSFKNDVREGIGQILYANGDEYIGNFKNGKKNGKGIFKWNDGCMYYGEYKDNKMDGFGSCYNSSGILIYEGQWKSNQIHGTGTYIWSDSKKYVGEFRNGKKHGYGSFYLDGELVYEGTWKFDKPSIFGRSLEEIFTVKF